MNSKPYGSVMKIDWPRIGAMSGLTASVLLVGAGAVAILRSGPDEVRKTPPPAPVLLSSSRRVEAAAAPVLQVYASSANAGTSGSAPVVPARERPAPVHALFQASETSSAPPLADAAGSAASH